MAVNYKRMWNGKAIENVRNVNVEAKKALGYTTELPSGHQHYVLRCNPMKSNEKFDVRRNAVVNTNDDTIVRIIQVRNY